MFNLLQERRTFEPLYVDVGDGGGVGKQPTADYEKDADRSSKKTAVTLEDDDDSLMSASCFAVYYRLALVRASDFSLVFSLSLSFCIT